MLFGTAIEMDFVGTDNARQDLGIARDQGIDLRAGQVIDRYERFAGASVLALDADLIEDLRALFLVAGPPRALRLLHQDGQALEIRRADLTAAARSLHWARLRFDPEHLLVLAADTQAAPGLLSIMMRAAEAEIVRLWVEGLLGYGVRATAGPLPTSQAGFLDLLRQLQQLDEDDLFQQIETLNNQLSQSRFLEICKLCG